MQVYSEAKTNDPDFALKESDVNRWGYELLQGGSVKEAVEVFKLNAEIYPQSANTYHSLAEAYAISGNKELAINNYKKVLELNPQNKDAAELLKKLEGK